MGYFSKLDGELQECASTLNNYTKYIPQIAVYLIIERDTERNIEFNVAAYADVEDANNRIKELKKTATKTTTFKVEMVDFIPWR